MKSQVNIVTLLTALVVSASALAHGQAMPTASRPGDLQIGGNAVYAVSNYLPYDTTDNSAPLSDLTRKVHLIGGGGYVNFDKTGHFGIELDFNHLNATDDTSAQTTFEGGMRYILTHRFGFSPYTRASFGYGLYSYPDGIASVGHGLYGLAGGTDYRLSHSFNLRAEYEYQSWINVPLRNPQPQVLKIGLAYHFHNDIRTDRVRRR